MMKYAFLLCNIESRNHYIIVVTTLSYHDCYQSVSLRVDLVE